MVILSKNVHWLNVAQVHWLLYAVLTNGNLRQRKSWCGAPRPLPGRVSSMHLFRMEIFLQFN
jgi:hypothetical protein